MSLRKQKTKTAAVYCIYCGRKIRPEYKFCIYCGKSTDSNPKCNPDKKQQDAVMDQLRGELDTIADTAPQISDRQLAGAFRQIHGKLLEVYQELDENRGMLKRQSVRSLIDIYLPGIIQVLNKYIDLQNEAGVEEKLAETRGSFRSVLDSLDAALDRLREELHGEDIMDMEVNLEVLDSLLHRM